MQYQPQCLKASIIDSRNSGVQDKLINEIHEHFSNICESCSPAVETTNGESDPTRATDEEELLGDAADVDADEGVTHVPIRSNKKLKKRPEPIKQKQAMESS